MSNNEPLLFVNGLNGSTGSYLQAPILGEQLPDLVQAIRRQNRPDNEGELRERANKIGHAAPKFGVDPTKLEESGWGVIFPAYSSSDAARQKEVEAIKEALHPLLDWRNKQTQGRFEKWVNGEGKGFMVGKDDKRSWLARHGMGTGRPDPKLVPYYLLIVASPEDIPFRFQSELDVMYAVGRLHFDRIEDYAVYAQNVVQTEGSQAQPNRRIRFFGVSNPGDEFTPRSLDRLITPLSDKLKTDLPKWDVATITGSKASAQALQALLSQENRPALLFTSSHGMFFQSDDSRQQTQQGALVCQDWPGPNNPVKREHYFAAEDLPSDANLSGLIAFFVACFGAGTPQLNEYSKFDALYPATALGANLASRPMLSQLPVQMLCRPKGGALAVVGHVERLWTTSFDLDPSMKQGQISAFVDMLSMLFAGHPIGSALDPMNGRYAELATELGDKQEQLDYSLPVDPQEFVTTWVANNDARGYMLVGDPAVRLAGTGI